MKRSERAKGEPCSRLVDHGRYGVGLSFQCRLPAVKRIRGEWYCACHAREEARAAEWRKPAGKRKDADMSSTLPPIVARITHNFDAWVVGSAARPPSPGKPPRQPRDWDLMVPFHAWHGAATVVPSDARPNSFGGWKFTADGVEVDMWPGDVGWLMQNERTPWAWHPRTGARLERFVVKADGSQLRPRT